MPCCSVADDGIGIDAELLPRIFEPVRAGRIRRWPARAAAWGIGLSLVRSLAGAARRDRVGRRATGPGRGSAVPSPAPPHRSADGRSSPRRGDRDPPSGSACSSSKTTPTRVRWTRTVLELAGARGPRGGPRRPGAGAAEVGASGHRARGHRPARIRRVRAGLGAFRAEPEGGARWSWSRSPATGRPTIDERSRLAPATTTTSSSPSHPETLQKLLEREHAGKSRPSFCPPVDPEADPVRLGGWNAGMAPATIQQRNARWLNTCSASTSLTVTRRRRICSSP